MSYTTLTRYLKLKIDSDLSADAVYNLQRIDALASTFVIDSTDKLKVQSKDDIEIEPNDTALGGTGSGGLIGLGTPDHADIEVRAYSASFKVDSGIETKNQASGKTNYLKLAFNSANEDARVLTLDLGSADRSIAFDHTGKQTVVVKDDNGNVTVAGTITAPAFAGDVTGDVTGNLTGNVTGDVTGNITGNLTGNVTGNVTGNLTGNVTGNADSATDLATGSVLDIGKGGTGAVTAAEAAENLLPSYSSNANKVLGLNSTGNGLEWKAAGSGIVETISVEGPLVIDNSVPSLPEISLPVATSSVNGYLASADWSTFNGKEPAITSGTTAQYWRGDKSWQTLDKSAVGLGNVDNTSDANKPISSATQTALNAKYDASNPAGYVDAAGAAGAAPVQSVNGQTNVVVLDTDDVSEGTAQYFTDARAKTAAVVNSTAGTETDQAPSVSAMKSYVTANSGPKYSTTWSVGDGNTKVVTHSLNTREVLIVLYDENYETVYIDSEVRTTVDSVTLTRTGTATGTWTVIIKKL